MNNYYILTGAVTHSPSEAAEQKVSLSGNGARGHVALGRCRGQLAASAAFTRCHAHLQPLDLVSALDAGRERSARAVF